MIDEGVLDGSAMWIAKRVYVRKCANHSVGRPRKRWIDIVKEWLKKIGLDVKKATRIVHDGVYGGDL